MNMTIEQLVALTWRTAGPTEAGIEMPHTKAELFKIARKLDARIQMLISTARAMSQYAETLNRFEEE